MFLQNLDLSNFQLWSLHRLLVAMLLGILLLDLMWFRCLLLGWVGLLYPSLCFVLRRWHWLFLCHSFVGCRMPGSVLRHWWTILFHFVLRSSIATYARFGLFHDQTTSRSSWEHLVSVRGERTPLAVGPIIFFYTPTSYPTVSSVAPWRTEGRTASEIANTIPPKFVL